jgi:hypothetical protein
MSGLAESVFVPLTISENPMQINGEFQDCSDLNERLQALLDPPPWLMDQGPEPVQDRHGEWQATNELQRDIDALSQVPPFPFKYSKNRLD